MKVDESTGNLNRFHVGSQVKGLVGYAHEFGDDLSASLQYHIESMTDHDGYRANLAAGMSPVDRRRQTIYFRVQKRMLHQTISVGIQAFAALEGGNHVNPLASYAIADGLNLEAGANLFGGKSSSRYGMMKHDSNVYSSLRFSF
jgi:phospholipase/lecithinase/hemolysin